MTKVKDFIKREIIVNAPLEKIWDALTKAEHLNRWYTKEATIDFRIGGKGFMNHGWGSTSEGIFTEIEEMRRFVLQSTDGDFTSLTELEVVQGGVKVSITYKASFMEEMDEGSKENMLFGTGQFLENLKSVYETGKDNRRNLWRTWIGISHTTDHQNGGTKVLHIKEGTPAAKALLLKGDIITGVDADSVDGYESLERLLNLKAINQVVTLKVLRDSVEMEIDCSVEPYPVAY